MDAIQKDVNTYRISDLTVGQSEGFSVTVTEQMQNLFRKITGDINPMHIDADFAKRGGTPINWFMAC